jgi:hypothetical protein
MKVRSFSMREMQVIAAQMRQHEVLDLIQDPDIRASIAAKTPLTKEQLRRFTKRYLFNEQLHAVTLRLAQNDVTIGLIRWVTLTIIALGTVAGGIAVIWQVADDSKNITGLAASGGIFLVSVLSAFIINPLQTIERDFVYRRWSDLIVTAFLSQLADDNTGFVNIGKAQQLASASFAALATDYASLAGKANDIMSSAIQALQGTATTTTKPDPSQLALTNPGPQKSTAKKQIDTLRLNGSGPGILTYTQEGLPGALVIDSKTGEISGIPQSKSASPAVVTITVKSDSIKDASVLVAFNWTVE